MLEAHRKVLKHFIDEDINTINMYWGYKGDFVLKLVVNSPDTSERIEDFCRTLDVEVKVIYDRATRTENVFIVEVDDDVIKLKE